MYQIGSGKAKARLHAIRRRYAKLQKSRACTRVEVDKDWHLKPVQSHQKRPLRERRKVLTNSPSKAILAKTAGCRPGCFWLWIEAKAVTDCAYKPHAGAHAEPLYKPQKKAETLVFIPVSTETAFFSRFSSYHFVIFTLFLLLLPPCW